MNSSCAVQNAVDVGLFGIFPVYATMWCACPLVLVCAAGARSSSNGAISFVRCALQLTVACWARYANDYKEKEKMHHRF
jgi:hypothetical protein